MNDHTKTSNNTQEAILHTLIDEYAEHVGESHGDCNPAPYLHEMVSKPTMRNHMWDEFIEYLEQDQDFEDYPEQFEDEKREFNTCAMLGIDYFDHITS